MTRVAYGRNERGFFLVSCFGMMVMLTMLGSVIMSRTAHEAQMGRWSTDNNQSVALAEAAVDATISQMRSGDFNGLLSVPIGDGTMASTVSAPGAPLQFMITGQGVSGGSALAVESTVQLTPHSVFQFAVFGNDGLVVDGNITTDSFDSRDGAYDALTAGDHGDIGTNSTAAGGIVVDGGIVVNGQVAVGPDVADPSSVVDANGGSYIITGSPQFVSQPDTLLTPAVVVPAIPCPSLTLGGGVTHTLDTAVGIYCFDQLTLSGGATLTANGQVKVYVTGEFKATGNTLVGVPSNPANFVMLLKTGISAKIDNGFGGTTQFYGGIYAPDAHIDINGNAEIFGSVIAGTAEVSGDVQVHYDEALGDLTAPVGLYKAKVLSWREP